MARFKWIRVMVDTESRDMSGGHGAPFVRDAFGELHECSTNTARRIKKADRKRQRRQAQKIHREAFREMEADARADADEMLDLDAMYWPEEPELDRHYDWLDFERDLIDDMEDQIYDNLSSLYDEYVYYDADYGQY